MDREWKLLPPTGSKRPYCERSEKGDESRTTGRSGSIGVAGGGVAATEGGFGFGLRDSARTFCSALRNAVINFKALLWNLFSSTCHSSNFTQLIISSLIGTKARRSQEVLIEIQFIVRDKNGHSGLVKDEFRLSRSSTHDLISP